MARQITLAYDAGAGYVSQTFDYLFVKGLDPVDDLSMFPGISVRLLDGSFRNRITNVCRNITVGLGVQNDYNDRLFLGRFAITETKKITITYDNPVDEAVKDIQSFDANTTPNVVVMGVTTHGWSNNDLIEILTQGVSPSPSVVGQWRIENVAASTVELVDCTGRSGVAGVFGTVKRWLHSITETDLQVVLTNPSEFNTVWLNGSEYARSVTLELREKTARTSFPT